MSKILLVEDSEEYQLTISAILAPDHEVVSLSDAHQIVDRVLKIKPDLILMDIGLPHTTGKDACHKLQNARSTRAIPILFVTGYSKPEDIANGLSLGAEDYITKPFNPIELKARCEARLRKAKAGLEREVWVRCAPVSLNILTRRAYCTDSVTHAEEEVILTPAEFQLLLYFAKNPDRDISRKEIESQMSSTGVKTPQTRVIDAQVKSLRKKCSRLSHSIISVYGVGYRFMPRT